MVFVNASLLLGAALIAVPVILHFAMRQQPKRLEFPALRFIRQRREANRRTLQLRHLLLLLLRALCLLLVVLAFARPTTTAAAWNRWVTAGGFGVLASVAIGAAATAAWLRRGRALVGGLGGLAVVLTGISLWSVLGAASHAGRLVGGDQKAPVAAVLVFDTAPHMSLRHENQTRLEAAQELGQWLLRQLPADSEVAVLGGRQPRAVFSVDRAAAQQKIERLETLALSPPLTDQLLAAAELLETSSLDRQEIYVLTDLAAAAWPADAESFRRRWAQRSVDLHIIDLGVDQPSNASLGELVLQPEILAPNQPLEIEVSVGSVGRPVQRTLVLRLEQFDPALPVVRDGQLQLPGSEIRGREEVALEAGQSRLVRFKLGGLPVGVHHGRVELLGQDGLAADDVRYFTVRVEPPWKVLVAHGPGADPTFLVEAISPYSFRAQGRERFSCQVVEDGQLGQQPFEDYAAICLLDPTPLALPQWERLAAFVRGGGGLAVFLGHNAEPEGTFHSETARQLLGGRLSLVWRDPDGAYFDSQPSQHPILQPFNSITSSVPWEDYPVYRYWGLDQTADSVDVLLRLAPSDRAGLLENRLQHGRVLVMTTPISDSGAPRGRAAWNLLVSGPNRSWPYFALITRLADYLVRVGETRANYLTGETVRLGNDPAVDPLRYQLYTPTGEQQPVTAGDTDVALRSLDSPGTYRLKGQRGGVVHRGFSLNLPLDSTSLERLAVADLNRLLGEGAYRYARNRDEVDFGVRQQRTGREFYPLCLLLAAVALALEAWLANRFYPPAKLAEPIRMGGAA